MNKLFGVLVWCMLSSAVQAQVGGIYVSAADPSQFVTVHQNGNTLVVLQNIPASTGGGVELGNGQYVNATLYALTYSVGQLAADGKTSALIGTAAAGACSASYAAQFSDLGLRMTLQGVYQNSAGSMQGIDCAALSTKLIEDQKNAGGVPLLTRIF